MAKMNAQANLIEFNHFGEKTAKNIRLNVRLCSGADPQVFEIGLPDKRQTRSRSIVFTRAEIERVLAANPKK